MLFRILHGCTLLLWSLQTLQASMDAALAKAERAKSKAIQQVKEEVRLAMEMKDRNLAMLHAQRTQASEKVQALERDLSSVVIHYAQCHFRSKIPSWVSDLNNGNIVEVCTWLNKPLLAKHI
jgi:multidrug resistance efflux pump